MPTVTLNPALPPNVGESPGNGATRIRNLTQAILDLFNLPPNTAITAPLSSTRLALTNRTGSGVVAGDVVGLDAGNDSSAVLADTRAVSRPLVVALATIANGAVGVFSQSGVVTVRVQGAVTRGHYLRKSSTTLALEDTGVPQGASPPGGSMGVAVTATAGPGAGNVVAMLWGTTFGSQASVEVSAATGDGATDDLAAIQAVIDAVGLAGGGTVVLPTPSAFFKTTGAIVVTHDNVKITGPAGFSRAARIVSSNGADDVVRFVGVNRCGIENLNLDYAPGVSAAANTASVHILNSGYIHVQDNIIGADAVDRIHGQNIGVFVEVTAPVFHGYNWILRNEIDWAITNGIRLKGFNATGVCAETRIFDNQIFENGSDGVALLDYVTGTYIERNETYHNDVDVNAKPTLSNRTFDLFIRSNVLDSPRSGQGILVRKVSRDVEVTTNWVGGGTSCGMDIGDSDLAGLNVVGNTLVGNTGCGIQVGGHWGVVSGNRVTRDPFVPGVLSATGISLGAASSLLLVTGNTVIDYSTPLLDSGSGNQVSNNLLA